MAEEICTPFGQMDRIHRRVMEGNRRLLHMGAETEKQATKTMMDGFGSMKSIQESGNQVGHATINSYLDTIETTVPGTETAVKNTRDGLEKQFESTKKVNDEVWKAFEEAMPKGVEANDDFIDAYIETVDRSIDELLEMFEDSTS